MSEDRALRYRKLAIAKKDSAAAKLLREIADEAEQGILCTPFWNSPKGPPPSSIGLKSKS